MIKALALVQTTDRNINQLQQNISQAVNPVLQNPISGGLVVSNQALVSGNNTVNHGLGRTLQGWFIVRYQGAWAQIFDNQNSNSSANKTLILNSNGSVTVDIFVF